MTVLAGKQAVVAPPAVPPVYGLLKAATLPSDDVRWQGGIKWAPEQIGGGGSECVDCEGHTAAMATASNPAVNQADPFLVFAEDHCSTFGFQARDYEARARRQLAAVESAIIAHEFQVGTQRDTCELDNVVLEDAIDLGGSGVAVVDAFALIEQALAELFLGRRCMIHVAPAVMTQAQSQFLVTLAGSQYVTALGSIVVADAGYRAVGGSHFVYGSSMVQLRLSPVDVPGTFEESVDRSLNSVVVYAERLALVQYDSTIADPGDAVVKVEVDTPVNPGS